MQTSLAQFANLEELRRYFQVRDANLRWHEMPAECGLCEAPVLQTCQGGCLGLRGHPRTSLVTGSDSEDDIGDPAAVLCDRLFREAVRDGAASAAQFLLEWPQVRCMPMMVAYPGAIVLDALAADLIGDEYKALRLWRRAASTLKEDRRQWALDRITDLRTRCEEADGDRGNTHH